MASWPACIVRISFPSLSSRHISFQNGADKMALLSGRFSFLTELAHVLVKIIPVRPLAKVVVHPKLISLKLRRTRQQTVLVKWYHNRLNLRPSQPITVTRMTPRTLGGYTTLQSHTQTITGDLPCKFRRDIFLQIR